MCDIDIVLTMVDRQILQSYCDMLDGLSQYLGDGYEIVLHSLEDCNHSAIKVINGFHTGMKKGNHIEGDVCLMEQGKPEQQYKPAIGWEVASLFRRVTRPNSSNSAEKAPITTHTAII